jgi:hypothetical protein
MLFREQSSGALAISQLTHAWLSGQILRAREESFGEPLLLAAEQHDIGWMDWETAPTFDPRTGRPHLFRNVGASVHAPMWSLGVRRAQDAWGAHVALLISRHGGVIYSRYTDRHHCRSQEPLPSAPASPGVHSVTHDVGSANGIRFEAMLLRSRRRRRAFATGSCIQTPSS